MTKKLIAVAALIAGAFFVWTVWPTPYRYEREHSSLIRINRMTGKTWDYLGNGTWASANGELSPPKPPIDPNAIDTGAAMAPAPLAMDTGMMMVDSAAVADSIMKAGQAKQRR
jgi:hypothetical protein